MGNPEYLSEEKRRYVRMDTVLPVQLRLESLDGSRFISGWLQGFTNNVSRGGICICINNLDPTLADIIEKRQARISLEIELAVFKRAITARARIAWIKGVSGVPNKYLIGICYEDINPKQNKRIMFYAWTRKIFIPAGLGLIVLLGLFVAANSLINIK